MAFFKQLIYLEYKMEHIYFYDKKIAKRRIGLHYLLTEKQLYTLILLELNIFHTIKQELNKIKDESITHNILRIQDKDFIIVNVIISLFIEYMLAGKTL